MKKLMSVVIAAAVAVALTTTGCGVFKVKDTAGTPYVTPTYVMTKAQAIALVVGSEALKNNPDARAQLELVQTNIRQIVTKPEVTGADVADIVARIPKVMNSKNYIYIMAGVLILQDDLNRVSVANPELFRAALQGVDQGLTAVRSQ